MAQEKIAQIWPEWEVEKQLGRGSYGVVYQVVRRDNSIQSRAAIKVISIPADASELDSLRSEGLSMDGAKTYFKGIVNDFVDEIRLMESLKGVQNIVSVEDYKVVERTDEVGWDIYIRMELLTAFNNYVCDKQLTEKEVIKLGVDICTALEICSQRNIVHRDIKPENIFINDFGYFKLGDFGIARKLENATGGLSQKGTFNYMAPEVATGTSYDARVDIYSLGIVLYRLLNKNRLPFIETEQQLLNPNERKLAVERRIRGERMAPPCAASAQVASVILRACAYNPANRFTTATEMKEALIQASMGVYREPELDLDKTVSVRHAAANLDSTVYMPNQGAAGAVPAGAARYHAPQPANTYGTNSNRTVPPVTPPPANAYGNNSNRTVPPANAYGANSNRTVPPVTPPSANAYGNNSNRTVPPVNTYGNNSNRTAPPVNAYGTGSNRTVPPVNAYGNNSNRTVPPVTPPPAPRPVTPPPAPQPTLVQEKAAKKLNNLCLMALVACALPLIFALLAQAGSGEMFTTLNRILAFVVPLLAIAGRGQTKRTNTKGNGIALLALVIGLIYVAGSLESIFYDLGTNGDMEKDTANILWIVSTAAALLAYVLAYLRAVTADKKK